MLFLVSSSQIKTLSVDLATSVVPVDRFRVNGFTVSPIKLEAGLRTASAGNPYTLLLRIEAMGFPTLVLLL